MRPSPVPVDHTNLEAIDHLAGAIPDHLGVDPRGTLEDVGVMGEPVEQGCAPGLRRRSDYFSVLTFAHRAFSASAIFAVVSALISRVPA
jgi:hypothetical protein